MANTKQKQVTKAQATKAFNQFKKVFKGWYEPEGLGAPKLIENWGYYPSSKWSIVWEEGPFDWAIDYSGKINNWEDNEGFYVEPINGWSLAVQLV